MLYEIRSQVEYETALKRIDELWGAKPNTLEGAEYAAIFEAVEQYEAEHWPMDVPDSYGAVEYHLDRLNLKIEDLPLATQEKDLLSNCLAHSILLPEQLLIKLADIFIFGIGREQLGRGQSSQEAIYAQTRAK